MNQGISRVRAGGIGGFGAAERAAHRTDGRPAAGHRDAFRGAVGGGRGATVTDDGRCPWDEVCFVCGLFVFCTSPCHLSAPFLSFLSTAVAVSLALANLWSPVPPSHTGAMNSVDVDDGLVSMR